MLEWFAGQTAIPHQPAKNVFAQTHGVVWHGLLNNSLSGDEPAGRMYGRLKAAMLNLFGMLTTCR